MGDEKPKTGHYLIGSAFLWAVGQWAVEWFVNYDQSLFRAVAVAAGGLATGWTTALLLGRFAKWGANAKVMMVLGLVLGVVLASGAATGVKYALSNFKPEAIQMDWAAFQNFLLSVAVLPAAALGILTGLYVRVSVPRKKKE